METDAKARWVSWYALFVLTLTYMLGNADRQILATMIVPVQRDLGLTDVELSMVQGVAFALFFSTGGLVAGWAIDRLSRPRVVMASLAGWSVCTGLSGMATGFWTLFMARCGVGMGESTMLPGGYSLISDLFPKRLLSFALGLYTIGANIGLGLSFVLGGAIAEAMTSGTVSVPLLGAIRSWQVAFLVLCAIGMLFAPLFLTFRDPIRHERLSDGKGLVRPAVIFLKQHPRLFTSHFLAFGLSNSVGLVMLTWAPALMQRKFGWHAGDVGPALGLVVAGAGSIGPLVVGFVAPRLDRAEILHVHYSLSILFATSTLVLALLSVVAPTAALWLCCMFGLYFMAAATLICGSAALQLVTPNELRGRMVAIYVAVGGILGAGAGPLLVALVTEKVLHDRNAVGLSMGLVLATFAIVMIASLAWGLPRYTTAREAMRRLFPTDQWP